MGRLIDADEFAAALKRISEKQGYSELYMNVDDVINAVIDDLQGNALYGYENCPTVEAIPKADYEAKLKADKQKFLDKIRADVEQTRKIYSDMYDTDWLNGCDYVLSVINKYIENNEIQGIADVNN